MHYHNFDGFPDFDSADAKSSKTADSAHFDRPLRPAHGPNCCASHLDDLLLVNLMLDFNPF